jgi:hypothetical protein
MVHEALLLACFHFWLPSMLPCRVTFYSPLGTLWHVLPSDVGAAAAGGGEGAAAASGVQPAECTAASAGSIAPPAEEEGTVAIVQGAGPHVQKEAAADAGGLLPPAFRAMPGVRAAGRAEHCRMCRCLLVHNKLLPIPCAAPMAAH